MSDVRPLDARLILTVFVVVLAVAFVAYRPAFTGAFELDDVSNLGELANVEDADSLLERYWRKVTRGCDAVWWWRWEVLGRSLKPSHRP